MADSAITGDTVFLGPFTPPYLPLDERAPLGAGRPRARELIFLPPSAPSLTVFGALGDLAKKAVCPPSLPEFFFPLAC